MRSSSSMKWPAAAHLGHRCHPRPKCPYGTGFRTSRYKHLFKFTRRFRVLVRALSVGGNSAPPPGNGARVRPGLLSGRAGRSAFSPGTTGLSLARPTAPMSMKHSCSPSSPIRHRGRGRLRCRAKILTTGTRQLPSFEDCQGWRAAGQHRWRRALLDGLSRYRSPWFRRPARNDLLVSDTMIDGVRATLAYSYPVSSSAPDQSIADIPAKAPLLMKRRPAFNPNSKAVMAPAATASLETLARCRVMSAIGTKRTCQLIR